MSPAPTAQPTEECFSSHTTVQVQGTSGPTPMDQVQVGDRVLVASSSTTNHDVSKKTSHYSKVHGFGHFGKDSRETEFLQIATTAKVPSLPEDSVTKSKQQLLIIHTTICLTTILVILAFFGVYHYWWAVLGHHQKPLQLQ